ncbi:hypothetical protein [Bradyrhizobium sp. Ai1a-2]|uniref:hypothetical protein n=1 Tax=Bradyrhizobium sp. Ai1a-2 TaxID=196490 RepID=UPI00041956AE|nr:hypothetical protein [Bradyrhizobium sp. Ai1a-2]
MYLKSAMTAALLVFAVPAFAQGTQGVAGQTTGQQMQKATKSTAQAAPKHKMKSAKKSKAPGASEPGQTTGSAAKRY